MKINAKTVKELRDKTGAGMMDCKKALEEAKGDLEKAMELLRIHGIASAEKREGRETDEGLIVSYIHPGNKLGVLLEINCETDFVARTDEFQELANEIAMQVAGAAPLFVSKDSVTKEYIEREKSIFIEQAKSTGKPDNIIEKIVEGKIDKHLSTVCLLSQPYIRDDSKTIEELLKESIGVIGENIMIKRFARFKLGAEE